MSKPAHDPIDMRPGRSGVNDSLVMGRGVVGHEGFITFVLSGRATAALSIVKQTDCKRPV